MKIPPPQIFLMCFYLAFHKIHYRVLKLRTRQFWLVHSLFIIRLLFDRQVNSRSVELSLSSNANLFKGKLGSTTKTKSRMVDSQRYSNAFNIDNGCLNSRELLAIPEFLIQI